MARPFQKGNPGGPGRPKGGYVELCAKAMKSEGWAAVINLARTGGPRRRAEIMLSAWTLVAAYAHGKPPQAVIADVTNHGPIPFQIVFGGSEANVTSTLTHGNGNGDAGREPAQVPGAGPTG